VLHTNYKRFFAILKSNKPAFMYINDTQLKDFILDSGLVSRSDFTKAEKEAKGGEKSISDILIGNGLITEDDLRRTHAYILGIPFVSLENEKIDPGVLSMIPEPIARKHNIIAYKKTDDSLEVAMLNTDDLTAIDFVKKKVRLKILPRLTDATSIKEVLKQYQKSLKDEFGEIIRRESVSLKSVGAEGDEMGAQDLKKLAEDLPVVRIVDSLLRHAANQNASDIHIEPMDSQVRSATELTESYMMQ
jgi:type IV pilus assembly protein PilB